MYNDLFDVLYSFEISEDTKSLIIENLQDQINEEVKARGLLVAFKGCTCVLSCFNHFQLFATSWNLVSHQGPLSMGFYRQEY